jgi:hypothetical protein
LHTPRRRNKHVESDILLTAFARGRQAVDSYVSESARQKHNWGEESATERLLMAVWPDVPYAPFNRRQEKTIGADWLWWFVDLTGECFGIIVQAKKMKQTKTGLTVDFKYPKNTGQQMNDLFATAREFNLPAAYMLYCGDMQYRRDSNSWCPACSGKDPHCRRCERAVTLLLPALAPITCGFTRRQSRQRMPSVTGFHSKTPSTETSRRNPSFKTLTSGHLTRPFASSSSPLNTGRAKSRR